MEDETVETTQQNPSEQTDENKTPVETETTTKTEHTDTEKRLYARAKEAEEAAKTAKAEALKLKEELAKAKLPISDVDAILEVQNSTRDLDTEEVTELKLRAAARGISLSEARNDKNYQVWQKGYREELNKSKALAPNTNQSEVDKVPTTLEGRLAAAKTPEEKGQILSELGLNPLTKNGFLYDL
jgi:hypothetical protein